MGRLRQLSDGDDELAVLQSVAFAFAVTPALLARGMFYAAIMGLLGGMLPAIRAARLPVVYALRQL